MFNKMKIRYFLALLAFTASLYISFLLSPFPDQAAAASGVITGSVVNIRSGAGTQFPVAGTVYKDTAVNILSQNGEWYQIQVGKTEGWVNQSLLSVTPSNATITVSQDLVNLRSGPGTNYSIVGQARKGDSLSLLNTNGDWYQAKTAGGQVIYIRSDMTAQPVTGSGNIAPAAAVTTTAASTQANPPIVMLDGKQMQFEVPPIIDNGRTLVPMRAIFEAMGAQVDWNDAAQTVTAKLGDTTIILTIGSTAPTVNGKVWPLDVPAKIVNNRTLAPLRFIGEALGGTVTWDDASNTAAITSPAVTPNTPAPVAVNTGSSTVNLRNGPGTSYNLVDTVEPGQTLKVLQQQGDWYQVANGGNNAWVASWVVTPIYTNEQTTDPGTSTPTTPTQPAAGLNSLTLSSERTSDGVKIYMASTVKLQTTKTSTTNQVNYTFADQQITGSTSLQEYLGSSLVTAQGSNQGNNAQVTINLPAGVQYNTSTDSNGLREVLFIPNFITSVARSTFGSTGEKIAVTSVTSMNYTNTNTSNSLTVTFNNVLTGWASPSYSYSNSLISSMVFKNQGQSGSVLTITTTKPVKFSVGPTSDATGLNILFVDQSELQNRAPVVVLDAGHGGSDPGASGTYLKEKDVTLAVALKAGQLLTAQGIKVVYTRTDDTYVGLLDRSDIANFYNAAVFVSVHCNASTSPTPSGTETYCYYPDDNPQLYMQKDERYNLALRLQQALVANLGLNDRGVKQSNLSVLRETNMPSALAELAFISTPSDEALLQQQQFRDKAAQAIATAIAGYMGKSSGTTTDLNNVKP